MTNTDTTVENEELSGTVLGIIGAYRIGAVLDAGNLHVEKIDRGPASPGIVQVPVEGSQRAGGARQAV
jgi:hypothetical protein